MKGLNLFSFVILCLNLFDFVWITQLRTHFVLVYWKSVMKLIYFMNNNWKFFKHQCVTFQKESKNYSEAKIGRVAYTLCFLLSISMYLWGCKIKIWIKWNLSKATYGCHALTHSTILTRIPQISHWYCEYILHFYNYLSLFILGQMENSFCDYKIGQCLFAYQFSRFQS